MTNESGRFSISHGLHRSPSTLSREVRRNGGPAWAPQQITGWLKRTYPGNEFYRVSRETIYLSLFV